MDFFFLLIKNIIYIKMRNITKLKKNYLLRKVKQFGEILCIRNILPI